MERSTDDVFAMSARHAQNEQHAAGDHGFIHANEPKEWLQRTIETEIIPRLMLTHRTRHRPESVKPAETEEPLGREDVESFTTLLLRDDVDAVTGFVGALRERNVSLESVYLGLVAPAARHLGELWDEDRCNFAQVTLGLWRLQNLVFDLSPELPANWTARPVSPRRALMVAAPGSQHTLGLLMVSEFFRREGWDVWSDPCSSDSELASMLRTEWFDLVGLSVGTDDQASALKSVILSLRTASRNPQIGVMVGGPALASRPQLVGEIGADFTAADARQAVERADAFVSMRCLQS